VEKELKKDQRLNLGALLNGKVPGLFGAYDTWGTGNSVILVDGIPQGEFYLSTLNMLEIETVVVLKDALSKAMYGAQGDQGVILVNTKRGKAGDHQLRVFGEMGGAVPRAMPEYLDAASYMEKYNQAQLNDGSGPSSLRYSEEAIEATRNGTNPARYPDNTFSTNEYIRDYTTGASVFADVRGGNQNTAYYVNTGWNQYNGWLNTPQGDVTNRLNFRGNLDFRINDYMEMRLDATARVSLNTQPNAGNIWSIINNELPNNYPILWDPGLITDEVTRTAILENAKLINGKLLGGNSTYLDNVYGTFYRNGNRKFMQRDVQFSGRLNLDLGFITEGLSGSLYGGMNFFNTLLTVQSAEFAVYEPVFNSIGTVDSVAVHGRDVAPNKYNVNANNSDFFRRVSYYGTLNYNKTIDAHKISANAVIYNNFLNLADVMQRDVLFHTGINASYLYNDRFAAEAAIMGIGSRKLAPGDRIELAPSVGVGWILSEEDFLADVSVIDYLKVRSTFGITKNDNWSDYFLYKSTFVRGASFDYQNGISRNGETVLTSAPNDISLQRRRDFTLGVDALLLENSVSARFGYFNSASVGNITRMSSTFPMVLGYEHLVYENYNSDRNQGLDLGLEYRLAASEALTITAGTNMLFISPKITRREEPFYEGEDEALLREGTATDAMWGLLSDGLYTEEDFDAAGALVEGLPEPTFGAVYPGDIKYLDQNDDGVIDQLDNRIIGHSTRFQYSFYLDLRYKKLEFFALGIGQLGDTDAGSGSYFRMSGNNKYSVMANDAYGPGNEDPGAIHPRLTTTDANHNDRLSDYWIYSDNSFTIPTMQLTYHLAGKGESSFIQHARIFLKAENFVILGKNKAYTELNPGGAPRTKGMSLGLITTF
jgi:TonB-linked SusC/RagA family outer membrane protein